MRKTFDAELQELNYEMINMAAAAEDAIDVVTESLASAVLGGTVDWPAQVGAGVEAGAAGASACAAGSCAAADPAASSWRRRASAFARAASASAAFAAASAAASCALRSSMFSLMVVSFGGWGASRPGLRRYRNSIPWDACLTHVQGRSSRCGVHPQAHWPRRGYPQGYESGATPASELA